MNTDITSPEAVDGGVAILNLFRVSPLTGLAVLVTLAIILWCAVLLPRVKWPHHRFLVGFIGLASVYNGLRLVKDAGVNWIGSDLFADSVPSLIVTLLYGVAVFVLEAFCAEHQITKLRLRVAEAFTRDGQAPDPKEVERRSAQLAASTRPKGADMALALIDGDGQISFANRPAQLLAEREEDTRLQGLVNLAAKVANGDAASAFCVRTALRGWSGSQCEVLAVGFEVPDRPDDDRRAALAIVPLRGHLLDQCLAPGGAAVVIPKQEEGQRTNNEKRTNKECSECQLQ
jgi:hypothetical protein